jgi:hypothetical protein
MICRKIILSTAFVAFSFGLEAQTWPWARSCDGIGGSEGTGLCCDLSGNEFLTGYYSGPMTVGSTTLNGYGVFLAKYDASGNALWARTTAGTGSDYGLAVKADQGGNCLLTGYFSSTTFSLGAVTLSNTGSFNAFLAKYDPSGNVLWARSSAGSMNDRSRAVCIDASGNSYIAGLFTSSTVVFGSFTLTNSGTYNSFIAKYDPSGNVLWARSSNGVAEANAVSADQAGNVYMCGQYYSPGASFGGSSLTCGSGSEGFLVKYDPAGNVLWARSSASPGGYNKADAVTSASGSAVYVSGNFSTTTVFGTYSLSGTTASNLFVTKYDGSGNVLWARTATGYAGAYSACNDNNSLYLSGLTSTNNLVLDSYTLNPGAGAPDPTFIARFDLNGNVTYAEALRSGSDDQNAIAIDQNCHLYLGGDFWNYGNQNQTFVIGTNTLTATGSEDAFIAKLSFNCQQDGITERGKGGVFQLYPNPSSGIFTVKLQQESSGAQLRVIDQLGRIVYENTLEAGENIIHPSLKAGLYAYILQQNGSLLAQGKLVID